jgi:hypothetical protein
MVPYNRARIRPTAQALGHAARKYIHHGIMPCRLRFPWRWAGMRITRVGPRAFGRLLLGVFQIHTALEECSVFDAEAVCHYIPAERALRSHTTRSDRPLPCSMFMTATSLMLRLAVTLRYIRWSHGRRSSKLERQIQIVTSTLLRAFKAADGSLHAPVR